MTQQQWHKYMLLHKQLNEELKQMLAGAKEGL